MVCSRASGSAGALIQNVGLAMLFSNVKEMATRLFEIASRRSLKVLVVARSTGVSLSKGKQQPSRDCPDEPSGSTIREARENGDGLHFVRHQVDGLIK